MADKKTRVTVRQVHLKRNMDFRRELFVIVMDGIPDPIKG